MLAAGWNRMGGDDHKHRALAKLDAVDHPLRLAILTSLSLREATAKEVAEELGAPLGKVRYQLDRLRRTGFARVKDKRQRRGVSEQVYAVRTEPFTELEFAELSASQKEKVVAGMLRAVFSDTARALRAGMFGRRDDFALTRMPLALDEKGWTDAVAIHREAQAKLLRVRDESRQRLEAGGGRVVEALAFLFLFEMAPPTPDH